MARIAQNVEIWQGEYKELPFSVVDQNGAPFDLTGATMTYKICVGNASGAVQLTKTTASGISITSATAGTGKITLAAVDTASISGVFYHELGITDASSHPEVGFVGTITINASAVF